MRIFFPQHNSGLNSELVSVICGNKMFQNKVIEQVIVKTVTVQLGVEMTYLHYFCTPIYDTNLLKSRKLFRRTHSHFYRLN